MAKALLNEAERFLLQNWTDARLLEEAMEVVRGKYTEVCERVVEAVAKEHPELDAYRIAVTQFWGVGYLGMGRKTWPGGESTWPSGFWVNNIRLEILSDENAEPPYVYIEFSGKSKESLDFDKARIAVQKAAEKFLAPEELKSIAEATEKGVLIWLPAPSKNKLLGALLDGDGEAFVKLLVSQFDTMTRFVPVLDKVFRECLTKE